MRTLLAVSLLLVANALADEHHFISPNGALEAYTVAANEDGTGMKILLRPVKSSDVGVLLRQNDRWIDVNWSPDSRFLAVIDHLDGHMSDVYVFGVTSANASATLFYHTPELHKYGVKWEVAGWDAPQRQVILDKTSGNATHQKVIAQIGMEPLKISPTE
jgi:hypothetical protein